MNKKTLSLVGMAVSVLIVLFGILAVCGALGGETYSAGSAPYDFDSGYATFGGDYYTYSVNNAAEAADAAQAASSNLREISDFLKTACGLFMMGFGLLGFCGFGIVFAGCKEAQAEITPVVEEVPAEEATEITAEATVEEVTDVPAEETVIAEETVEEAVETVEE